MTHVLVVEDEVSIANALKAFLKHEGFECTVLHSALDVTEIVKRYKPDLVVLDIMLPGGDGLEICKELREQTNAPIILLTARASEKDRLIGLQAGADDYVCKPFSAPELVLRIKAILRRAAPNVDICNSSNALVLDSERQQARFNKSAVDLTKVEYLLLQTFLSTPNRIYSRSQLMSIIYSDNRVVSDRTVDSHVSKLRKKIQSISEEFELIIAVYGSGYKYAPIDH
ncbi:response regulator [Glaciecola siphonariae]|uniref:Response regulator n=1 Tax=Glaciecola siphonariae TaxID=521012 RepID=A0ABV9LUP4_9ALTE